MRTVTGDLSEWAALTHEQQEQVLLYLLGAYGEALGHGEVEAAEGLNAVAVILRSQGRAERADR